MPLRLFKRKTLDGKFVYHYRGTVAGNRLRGSTGTADRKLALEVAAKAEDRAYKGSFVRSEGTLTFPAAVALYLKTGKSDKYLGKIEDYWKNAKVKAMTAGAIRQSAIDIYPEAGWATRNRQVITPTQAVINHCAELELCPPIRVKRFKFDRKIKPPILLDWVDAFCAKADPDIAALAVFMFATGCRISEARRLQWADINFDERSVLIRKTKTKRQRLPHMPSRLLVALANLPRDKAPFGRPESTLRRAWDRAVKDAGLSRMTFHSCRHGFATQLLRDKVDVVTVAKLGGWESPHQVLETYAHAINNSSLTDRLFDTQPTRDEAEAKEIKKLG